MMCMQITLAGGCLITPALMCLPCIVSLSLLHSYLVPKAVPLAHCKADCCQVLSFSVACRYQLYCTYHCWWNWPSTAHVDHMTWHDQPKRTSCCWAPLGSLTKSRRLHHHSSTNAWEEATAARKPCIQLTSEPWSTYSQPVPLAFWHLPAFHVLGWCLVYVKERLPEITKS